jgi:hypothetical protein
VLFATDVIATRDQVRARQLLADPVEHLSVGLQIGVADLAVQLDDLLQLGDRPAELALSAVDHRHVIASHRLPGPVPDRLPDRQRLPVVLQRRCGSPRPRYTSPLTGDDGPRHPGEAAMMPPPPANRPGF